MRSARRTTTLVRRCGGAGGGAFVGDTEDASDASFAGLQDTYLWVTDLTTDAAARAQLLGEPVFGGVVSYRRQRGLPEDGVAMAVVVQKMVDARTAGVMFTRSPRPATLGDHDRRVRGAWARAVVGGEVTPDRWVVGKITGEITVRDISDKHIQHVPLRRRRHRERRGRRRTSAASPA